MKATHSVTKSGNTILVLRLQQDLLLAGYEHLASKICNGFSESLKAVVHTAWSTEGTKTWRRNGK
jgi:hypothetical protein